MSAPPPYMRPPGSHHSRGPKFPSLKIRTPMKPDGTTSIPTAIPTASSSSSAGNSIFTSPLITTTTASSTSPAVSPVLDLKSRKKKPPLKISINSLTSDNTQKQQQQQQQQQSVIRLLEPTCTTVTDMTTPIKLDNCSIRSFKTEETDNSTLVTKSSSITLTSEYTESSLMDTFNSLSLTEDHYSRQGSSHSSIDASSVIAKKRRDSLSENEWKELNEKCYFDTLEILGEGNGGSVKKCKLRTSGEVFALKTITADPSPEFQKQIVRELNFNRSFQSEYIVKYYGAFFNESDATISICMEYMGGKSLDAIYKCFKVREGRIGEKPLGKISEGVLRGLSYLNSQKIMHRDIKPQNILLDSKGNVKLCDFGVSGEVVNSLATTFTGTSFYMAPERIRNEPYTITCDVWSLGLTLLEGAMGIFPFFAKYKDSSNISPIDLLVIILGFKPQLDDEPEEGISWSNSFKDFIKISLTTENRRRPSPRQMLEHPWMKSQMKKRVKMDKLVEYCWGHDLD